MATEADARARAAVDLSKLLVDVRRTSTSFVLDVPSGTSDVHELWECLPDFLETRDISENNAALLTPLLDAGGVSTFVGLMLDFPSPTCSEPPIPWTTLREVSGESRHTFICPLSHYSRGLRGTWHSALCPGSSV